MLSLEDKTFDLFIGGEFTEAAGGQTAETTNPGTGEVIGHVAQAQPGDVDEAVASAHATFEDEWGSMDPYKRGRALEDWAEILWDRRDQIAKIETTDQGKTLREAQADVAFAIKTIEYYAGLTDKVQGEEIPVPGSRLNFTRKEPLGVTGHVSPWNYPFQLAVRSLAPALAAGNTAVLKPASWTPLSSLALAETASQALPDGALNVVPGRGSLAGDRLVEHPDVRALSFTGSTDTGIQIGKKAMEKCVPATLELGGKCPNVVFEDAELDKATKGAIFAGYMNAGQMCWAGSRLLVQESVADDVVDNLAHALENTPVGPGTDEASQMGPLVSEQRKQEVEEYIEIAESEGLDLVTGGGEPDDVPEDGHYLEQTLFKDVPRDSQLAREEIFGPIVTVHTFEDEEEAVEIANDTEYGLYAYAYTSDMGRAMRLSEALEAGVVSINESPITFPQSPFGGHKDSGIGHEQGQDAIEHYTKLKTVFFKEP
jgi:aldehyde dehydrogenase (NAD+)